MSRNSSSWWRKALSRSSGSRTKRRIRQKTARPRLEALEQRNLMTNNIVWVNEGPGGDYFEENFDTNADEARAIVHQAISDWQKVITNFGEYYDVVGGVVIPLPAKPFDIIIDAKDLGKDKRGEASPFLADITGKPSHCLLQLDDDGGGEDWSFDTTPGDDAEFTNIQGLFSAVDTAAAGFDFYRTVAHEMGHCFGILDQDLITLHYKLNDPGVIDPVDTDFDLKAYNGTSDTATFTTSGVRHYDEC